LILVLSKKSWPICCMISDRRVVNWEFIYPGYIDAPLWGMPILPVSLIISGMSLVSSTVDEMRSSNYSISNISIPLHLTWPAFTRDIFTDWDSAWESDSFVLCVVSEPRKPREALGMLRTYSSSLFEAWWHRCISWNGCHARVVRKEQVGESIPAVACVVVIQVLHFDIFGGWTRCQSINAALLHGNVPRRPTSNRRLCPCQ